ncbi:competence protein CoiA [Cellulomonas sp. P24]|uniref:competence protein CoiA n=1 Tax=Cellulomonas sp. P24 TaxID=2885206 RepID=UPI00216B5DA5|nr:competence protein CoiA [Cellulomonas sp. P24]MCR6491156.1 competence protein CoiA [Cellulomonas sp. P24]
MGHTPGEVAAFTSGETRLVYAARKDAPTGPLVLLEDNTALEMREYAKAHLRCFVAECPTPEFTTVARRSGRDGFKHLTGGGHSEESLFHKQGKHALLGWLARRHPEVDARLEVSLLPVVNRRADVLAVHPTGERVALEVQYSHLELAEGSESWAARTRDYQDAGIAPVWILGHRGVHFTDRRDGTVALGALGRAILEAGMPLWWVNPILGTVAVPYVISHVGERMFQLRPTSETRAVHLWVDSLDTLTLTGAGVHSPRLDFLDQQRRAHDDALAAARAHEATAEAERNKQAALAAKNAAQRAQHVAAKAARLERALRERLRAQEQRWLESSMRANVLAAHGNTIPAHLDVTPSADAIWAHHQHWQALVFGHVMLNHIGDTVTVRDCLSVLDEHRIQYNADAHRDCPGSG